MKNQNENETLRREIDRALDVLCAGDTADVDAVARAIADSIADTLDTLNNADWQDAIASWEA